MAEKNESVPSNALWRGWHVRIVTRLEAAALRVVLGWVVILEWSVLEGSVFGNG